MAGPGHSRNRPELSAPSLSLEVGRPKEQPRFGHGVRKHLQRSGEEPDSDEGLVGPVGPGESDSVANHDDPAVLDA